MANNTPHIVGGGLGTFRKEARARHEREVKAQRARDNAAALAKVAKAGK